MEEVFYEDILETFLFCFIASMGLVQIMVAKRGWHGLSLYGGRLRPAVNYVLGAVLLVFAYAWYFSDPLHRNVRNIEAFMSLLCLVLGIAAAGAATAVIASAVEASRRRFGRGRKTGTKATGRVMERLELAAGTVLVSGYWGDRGENLVVVAEPGGGSERLVRSLYAELPDGHGVLSLHPFRTVDYPDSQYPDAVESDLRGLLDEVMRERGLDLRGETFLGLGWGGNVMDLFGPYLESGFKPRKMLSVAPVVPDCIQGFVGDALLSDTPFDVLETLSQRKPWKDNDFLRILRIWFPVMAACVVAATAVTVGFDVRWKLFSGPMTGLLLSLWVTYFLARRRGGKDRESVEKRLVSRLCEMAPGDGSPALTVVLTSGGSPAPAALPPEEGDAGQPSRCELWEDVLRGKFILRKGTPDRLAALIWEETPGYEER